MGGNSQFKCSMCCSWLILAMSLRGMGYGERTGRPMLEVLRSSGPSVCFLASLCGEYALSAATETHRLNYEKQKSTWRFFKIQNNDARLDWSRQKVGRLAHLQPKKTKQKKTRLQELGRSDIVTASIVFPLLFQRFQDKLLLIMKAVKTRNYILTVSCSWDLTD